MSYRPLQERQDSNLRMVVLEATAVAAEPLSQKVRGRIRTAVMTLCRRLPSLWATRTYEAHAPHINADREHRTRTGHPTGFKSSASTNSTRPAQCQWRESNSHPFGAASQTTAPAVTPHWQKGSGAIRTRRTSFRTSAGFQVRRNWPFLPRFQKRSLRGSNSPGLAACPVSSGVGLPTCPKAPTEGERVERS